MNNALYNPFFNATRDVFELMLALNNITNVPCPLNGECVDSMDVAIAIDIVGDLEGKVIYRFPKETSLKMVKILSGMEVDEVDDFVTSAMGEIANIISGNVLSDLSTKNLACDILPPKFITSEIAGDADSYDIKTGMQICTDIGCIQLDILLNNKIAK